MQIVSIYITVILRLVCFLSCSLLIIRTWTGPISGLISPRSTLNIAAIAFLSLVGLLFTRSTKNYSLKDNQPSPIALNWILLAILVIATIIPYLSSLDAPFLFDDYVHLGSASAHDPLSGILHRIFVDHPHGGDGFFRPLGLLYLWLTFKWAGWNTTIWHLCGLTIHAANTILIFFLLKRIFKCTWAAFSGALLFAWHASHVEAVCWTAASFDLLATFFSLVVLILALAPEATFSKTAAIIAAAMLACLSKESAYCLPLLVACAALFPEVRRRQVLLNSLWTALACSSTFLYRIWYLQGIGGYRTATGSPMVFNLHPLSAAQALLLRLWALLLLPVNWSTKPELWLRLTTVSMLVSFIVLMLVALRRRNTSLRHLYASLLFTLCAAIPVLPLLLIGWDLAGARVLYLPSVGLCLFWTAILAVDVTQNRSRIVLASITFVAIFQLGALLHNQFIWKQEAKLANHACADVATFLKDNPQLHVYAIDLPRTRNGVYFLGNGFSECVAQAAGNPLLSSRVSSIPPPSSTTARDYFFTWDEQSARVIAIDSAADK